MTEFTRREVLSAGAAAAVGAAFPATSFSNAVGPSTGAPAHGWQYASAAEVARAIQTKQVSSVEVTQLILNRIHTLNPKLNAIVTLAAESALKRAQEADAATAKGVVWGPLHGVPCTIKDTFETQGVRTTAGAPVLKDHIPKEDAVIVGRLRAAGMVMLGKSNVPFMAGDYQSYNEIFGTTNNPWDLTRTPGGSTGGGAAALAAGLGYLTVGSDLGGSIRTPAHFCGVFGHKPTISLVPFRGHIPPMPGTPVGDSQGLAVAGPLARSAADLALALRIIGGPVPENAIAYGWTLPAARKKSIRDYRIGYVLDHPLCPVTHDVKLRLQAAVDALRATGAKLEQGFPAGINVREQFEAYMTQMMFGEVAGESTSELERIRASHPAEDDCMGLAMKRAAALTPAEVSGFASKRLALRLAWQPFFRDFDAVLTPVDFITAFAHDHSEPEGARMLATPQGKRRYWDQLFWISFATVTGLPATVGPVGLTPGACRWAYRSWGLGWKTPRPSSWHRRWNPALVSSFPRASSARRWRRMVIQFHESTHVLEMPNE
jgi:amidase